MKSGLSLTQLATELERQAAAKKDYLAHTGKLKMEAYHDNSAPSSPGVILQGVNGGMLLKPIAHQQLAASLQIPKAYYDRMLAESPDLLARNVNVWLEKQPAKKLIRTLDGEVRAILSDSYRPLDNLDFAMAIVPQLGTLDVRVESCQVTDSRLYLKCVSDRIQGETKVGDIIQSGMVASNSEVGMGTLMLAELDWRKVCSNGMIREQTIRKTHLGRQSRFDALEDAREYYRTETRQADDRAFFLKVQDATRSLFTQERLDKRLLTYKEAAGVPTFQEPQEVVEVTAKHFGFTDGEKAGLLKHFYQGNDTSKWGLANAVTRMAQDVESYDRSTELEAIGGKVIELPQATWKVIAGTSNAV